MKFIKQGLSFVLSCCLVLTNVPAGSPPKQNNPHRNLRLKPRTRRRTSCSKWLLQLRCIRMLWLLKSSRPQPIEGMVARDGQEVVARNGKRLCSLRWGLEAVFPLQIAPQFDIGTLETIIVTRAFAETG